MNHVSTWKVAKTNGEVCYIRAAGPEEPYVPFDDMVAIINYVDGACKTVHLFRTSLIVAYSTYDRTSAKDTTSTT